MPFSMYNNPMAEAATMGAEAGNTLAQRMYGVPMQRAEMQMRLMELQRQMLAQQQMGGYRQAQMGYNQQRLQDLEQFRDEKNRLGLQTEADKKENWDLRNQIDMMRAQSEQQNANTRQGVAQGGRVEGGVYLPFGGGQGQQPQGNGLPVDVNVTDGQFLQQGGGQQSSNGLPSAIPGVQGSYQVPKQFPPRVQPRQPGLTPDALLGAYSKIQALQAALGSSTNDVQRAQWTNNIPYVNSLSNRIQGAMQGGQGLPQVQQPQPSAFNWDPTNGLQRIQ